MLKPLLIFIPLLLSTSAFAEPNIKIVDRTDDMALIQIDGEVARVLYNLIDSGKTSQVRGSPARAGLRSEKVGQNISCVKVRAQYACRLIGMPDGKLIPETYSDLAN